MKKLITSPKVFVIVLNYNGIDTLNECLTSVFRSNYNNFEVVVVDNDSRDGSFEKARHNFSRAHFIKNSSNVGFAQGNNVGIRFALEKFADYVFLLNNDATIEPTTITTLIKIAQKNSRVGILSPVIKKADGNSIWFAGGTLNFKKMRAEHNLNIVSDQPYQTQYISGCAMLVKKDVFKSVGLFDERYFLYYEDADLSFRASEGGFDLLIIPESSATHFEQSNEKNNSKIYWLVLSGLLFFLTHSKGSQKLKLHIYVTLRKTKNLYDVIAKRDRLALDIRKAFKDYSAAKNSK